jgi:hypothetical protein
MRHRSAFLNRFRNFHRYENYGWTAIHVELFQNHVPSVIMGYSGKMDTSASFQFKLGPRKNLRTCTLVIINNPKCQSNLHCNGFC